MVLTVFVGIANFERALIRSRTSAGRSAAAQRGVGFGRPSKLGPDQAALAQRLVGEGKVMHKTAKLLQVHVATSYRAFDALPASKVPRSRPAKLSLATQPSPKS